MSKRIKLFRRSRVAPPAVQTLISFDAVSDAAAIWPSVMAGDRITMRPYLPWNHSGGFRPINGSPHVYVYPDMPGIDQQPLGVDPFPLEDGLLQIEMATASPAVQSNIIWPDSANGTTGAQPAPIASNA